MACHFTVADGTIGMSRMRVESDLAWSFLAGALDLPAPPGRVLFRDPRDGRWYGEAQAGALFRLMSDEERGRLMDNLATAMHSVPQEIIARQIERRANRQRDEIYAIQGRYQTQIQALQDEILRLGPETDGCGQRLTGQHMRPVKLPVDHPVQKNLPVRLRFQCDVKALVLEVTVPPRVRRHLLPALDVLLVNRLTGVDRMGKRLDGILLDLVPDDVDPRPIHLGFRSGVRFLKTYLHALQDSGMNHVALNLRFNQTDIETTLTRLAENVLPDFPE